MRLCQCNSLPLRVPWRSSSIFIMRIYKKTKWVVLLNPVDFRNKAQFFYKIGTKTEFLFFFCDYKQNGQDIALITTEVTGIHTYSIWYDIFVNCSWVDNRWQWNSTHLRTYTWNNTMKQNTQNRTYITIRIYKHDYKNT
jgi:hypothetical protein